MISSSDELKTLLIDVSSQPTEVKTDTTTQEETHWSPLIKNQLNMSLPIMGINIIDSLQGFANGVLLGKIGGDALPAGSIIGSTNLVLTIAMMAPLHASSLLISEAKGSENFQNIRLLWRQNLIIACPLSIASILIMQFGVTPALLALGQPADITDQAQHYFNAYCWGVLPNAWSNCFDEFALGINNKKIVIAMKMFRASVSIGTAYLLGLGTLGIDVGIESLGYAFTIQAILGLVTYITLASCQKELKEYQLLSILFTKSRNQLQQLWRTGWPLAISSFNELSAEFLMTIFMGKFGKTALSAKEITTACISFLQEPTFALARGAGLLISNSMGHKYFQDARRYAIAGNVMGLGINAIGLIIFSTLSKELSSFFINTDDPENNDLNHMLQLIFLLTAIKQLVDSVRNITFGALTGLPDTFCASIISTLCTWLISIPMAYLLANETDLQMSGLYLGQTIGLTMASMFLVMRCNSELTKRSELAPIEPPPAAAVKDNSLKQYMTFFFRKPSDRDNVGEKNTVTVINPIIN